MKKFTTIKVGYTAGVYGCSGEYFLTIIMREAEMFHVYHYGMYGSEERVNAVLKSAGYEEYYIGSWFGKMTKKDVGKRFVDEYQAIDEVKSIIETGKYTE
jgi:hypothetical protein